MKLYNSFLLRCWVIRGAAGEPIPGGPAHTEQAEKMVFDIEHIQRGEHCRAAGPDEAIEWIVSACRVLQETAPADGETDD